MTKKSNVSLQIWNIACKRLLLLAILNRVFLQGCWLGFAAVSSTCVDVGLQYSPGVSNVGSILNRMFLQGCWLGFAAVSSTCVDVGLQYSPGVSNVGSAAVCPPSTSPLAITTFHR